MLLQKGKTIEMTTTTSKGKLSGTSHYKINDVKKQGSDIVADVSFIQTDNKDKEVAKGAMTMKCNNSVYQVDMRQFIPQQSMQQMKDLETDAEFYLYYPKSMKVGDALEPGEATIAVSNSGMNITTEIKIDDRKVVGEESVTTPAGTWTCYKITSKVTMRTKLGAVGIPFNYDNTEYFAPGFGIVKSEGKYGKTELTTFK